MNAHIQLPKNMRSEKEPGKAWKKKEVVKKAGIMIMTGQPTPLRYPPQK